MILQDSIKVESFRRTGDGYLTVNARVARTGIQNYLGSEVGKPELGTVRVYRPEESVFNSDTLASFAHRPVTFGHPSSGVNAMNWKDVAKGWSGDEVVRDGEFVRVSMLIADADTITSVENGTRELSMGYDCTLDWTPGKTSGGDTYDAVQRSIRSNHIAVVDAARGGRDLRLGDSNTQTQKALHMMTDSEKQSMRDSVRGMPLAQAAELPIYEAYKGLWNQSMPANELAAIHDGAAVGDRVLTGDQIKAEAARDHMIADMNSWRNPVNDNATKVPQFARDGRPMDQLTPSERAYEQMTNDTSNAWRTQS